MQSKFELAKVSFSTVLRHVEHEDDKANRIMFAMAFTAAAAAAVFATVLGEPDPVATIAGKDINVTILSFSVFVLLVATGTLCLLAALGPKHNLTNEWHRKQSKWSEDSSLLFAPVIQQHPYEVWNDRWRGTTDEELEQEMQADFTKETYLLARKAEYKVNMMSYGRSLYKLAFVALVVFLAVSLADELELGLAISGLAVGLYWVQVGLEAGSEPDGLRGIRLRGLQRKPKESNSGLLALADRLFPVFFLCCGVGALVASFVLLCITWR